MNEILDCTTFDALGTSCAVHVTTTPLALARARHAAVAARSEVHACERALSRFDPESDLSRLNAAAGEWVEVDERLLDALEDGLRLSVATGGRCDPTVLPALVAAGYDRSFEKLDQRAPEQSAQRGAGVLVDRSHGRARVSPGSAAVDLGATAKGWIAARAIDVMRADWPELPGALVDLGGDLAVAGLPPEEGSWLVDVEDPRRPGERVCRLRVCSGGVATSGPSRRRFGPGLAQHHLIDPRTRRPATAGPLAATAVHESPAAADAHATALVLTPVDAVTDYVAARPGLGAVVVPPDGPPLLLGEVTLA